MPDYHEMLENVLQTEQQCTTEINRLAAVREQARGQIALLRHLIAIEANDATSPRPVQPGALPAGVVQPGASAPDSGAEPSADQSDRNSDPNATA